MILTNIFGIGRRLAVLSVTALLLLFGVSCSKDGSAHLASISVSPGNLKLEVGASKKLSVGCSPSDAVLKNVVWSSSNPSVATVSSEGTVTAVSAGDASITVSCSGKSAVCNVVVYVPVSSVSLENDNITMGLNDTRTLKAAVLPKEATNKDIIWFSSNPSVATVSEKGVVTALSLGSADITAASGGKTAVCRVKVEVCSIVDMGLSVKWADRNLGALSLLSKGDHYAWGETEPKTSYTWENYKWYDSDQKILTKYNNRPNAGIVDNILRLEPSDDAAHVKLGGKWRMPTKAEFEELMNNCTKEYVTESNGIKGFWFTSKKNGNKLFLPETSFKGMTLEGGGGHYWTSEVHHGSLALMLYFHSGYRYSSELPITTHYRIGGKNIRPVLDN